MCDWFEITGAFHDQTFEHDCRLASLDTEWQRELAALWRLEADVNNGGYVQFLCNWGRDSYDYALQALQKIGAVRMTAIVVQCQVLIDEHWVDRPMDQEQIREQLPKDVWERILNLSYEFMDYPDNITSLGLSYYKPFLSSNN